MLWRLSRPKAQSTWNTQGSTYTGGTRTSQSPEGSIYMESLPESIMVNKTQVSVARRLNLHGIIFYIDRIMTNKIVSVARRLNLHGITNKTIGYGGDLSQSPEGSIYME